MGRMTAEEMAKHPDADCFRVEADGGVSIDVARLMGQSERMSYSYQIDPVTSDHGVRRWTDHLSRKSWMTDARMELFEAAVERGRRVAAGLEEGDPPIVEDDDGDDDDDWPDIDDDDLPVQNDEEE